MSPVSGQNLKLGAVAALIVGVITSAVFLTMPEIDLWVASQFGSETEKFPLRFHPVPRFFNDLVNILAAFMALGSLAGLTLTARYGGPLLGLWARHYGYLLATLAVGPGLIANALLKENWGRARPRHLVEFGGDKNFSPPIVMSDQCSSNCSFVSGDASLAFFFLAVALIMPPKHRRLSVFLALLFGCLIGFMRIIQGAHFLSDVILAGVFVCLTALGLYWFMLKDWKAPSGAVSLGTRAGLRSATGRAGRADKGRVWMLFRAKPQDLGVED